jgi:hypothetical protein
MEHVKYLGIEVEVPPGRLLTLAGLRKNRRWQTAQDLLCGELHKRRVRATVKLETPVAVERVWHERRGPFWFRCIIQWHLGTNLLPARWVGRVDVAWPARFVRRRGRRRD